MRRAVGDRDLSVSDGMLDVWKFHSLAITLGWSMPCGHLLSVWVECLS